MVEWDESYKGSPSLPNGAGYSLNVLYSAHKGSQTFLNVSLGVSTKPTLKLMLSPTLRCA